MVANQILRHLFSSGRDVSGEGRFQFNSRSRASRMREISGIVLKHNALRGFTPVEFRRALEQLGPSFVKIGQTLSMRSEILPKVYCDELTKLQADCDPLPFDQIQSQLRLFYGERYDEVFASIDPKPLGSASLAQVHRAQLQSGQTVAVKVQRPGVKETMAQDIDIMRMLARKATLLMKDEQMLDFQDVVEEMWDTFLEETDFEREARNLIQFRQLNQDVAYIDCPQVHPELSGEYVLVMEYVEGIPIRDADRLREAGYDLAEIGRKILDNYATQVLEHGFFHADPHPGNIIIREGKVVYIDLGIMGRMTPSQCAGFARIIKGVGMGNTAKLKEALLSFAVAKDNAKVDHARFLADLDLLLGDYGSCDMGDLDIGLMLSDILALTRMSRVTLPSAITNVSRGFVTIEGTVASYIPNDNIVNIINQHLLRVEKKRSVLEELESAGLAMRQAGEGLVDASQLSGETLRMLTRGQLKLNMEMLGSEAPMASLGRIMNRLSMAIIIAGLFIGSSLFAPYGGDPRAFGMPLLSFFGYAGAMALSVWVVYDIWRHR
ncbi:AarF/ABC1/UbiB kinase family protein [Eggerthellaceae bacterium zg-1084]|uniref:AarF/ABC1/UbiB kinase family protein n=1 Tax=Berryella wangjianweii TaxID=2734634 RepID=A0A6M8J238_9ACTN|nr:lipopolysaccharide core heptose(II) kinase RfaY [Berryella wangjianweii]NPD30507.1 AarF/ABC1/UbiB kinase family protein [Berryella wangjianweii]NPD32807.1 AarF/ABC1/UbiB kinase family protein [Eggerthellaceae bacterium zg-997]QKF07171.1 AarF/ABC1/UbiB kinase family protein [Berryella wangjianweii]